MATRTSNCKISNPRGMLFRGDYEKCSLEGSATNADFSNAHFSECDFTQIDFRETKFRLSCTQGVRNKLTIQQFAMFVYWIDQTFELPSAAKRLVAIVVGPYKDELKAYFERQ